MELKKSRNVLTCRRWR